MNLFKYHSNPETLHKYDDITVRLQIIFKYMVNLENYDAGEAEIRSIIKHEPDKSKLVDTFIHIAKANDSTLAYVLAFLPKDIYSSPKIQQYVAKEIEIREINIHLFNRDLRYFRREIYQ